MSLKNWATGAGLTALALAAAVGTTPAKADSIGVAVSGIGSNSQVGITGNSAVIGNGAIGFFIPLGNNSGTYGAGGGFPFFVCGANGFGTCSDTGNGGGTLTMYLKFAGVSTSSPSTLNIRFDDLDLIGANDPIGHLETLNVFDKNGISLTGLITNIGGLVTGNSVEQDLALNLGTLSDNPYYLQLKFKASDTNNGTNTEEFLKASIVSADTRSVPGPIVGAGLPGLISAAAGLLFLARRRGVRDILG